MVYWKFLSVDVDDENINGVIWFLLIHGKRQKARSRCGHPFLFP